MKEAPYEKSITPFRVRDLLKITQTCDLDAFVECHYEPIDRIYRDDLGRLIIKLR